VAATGVALYLRVVAVMAVAAALRAALALAVPAETLHADVHGIGAFVGVVSAVYSIVVAFVIYVVWDQFNRVATGVAHEAAAIEDLARAATFLSDRDAATRVRVAARQYLRTATADEPTHLARGRMSAVAAAQFVALCHAVRVAEVKTEKDGVVYGELLATLRRVHEARDDRLAVSAARIPGTLWQLLVFGACTVLAGVMVLGVQATPLAIGVAATTAGTLAFILGVVRDMDNPFRGAWTVSYEPMTAAWSRLA
jgi:hypothetical protein